MTILILICVLILISIIYFVAPFIRQTNQLWNTLDKIPGPSAFPFFGNVIQFIGSQGKLLYLL